MKDSSKMFELLGNKIRLDIITQLNIGRMAFSELLAKKSFKGIRSNKFSFHIRKLVDSEIIQKVENFYELTEFGLTTLKFVEAFESDQQYYYNAFDEDFDDKSVVRPKQFVSPTPINVPERPSRLPPAIRTFSFFKGKNSKYMEEKYFLPLPEPLSHEIHPQQWIINFYKDLEILLEESNSKTWLKDRLLKLAFGTRGLQDFGLMDASLAVPPLKPMFTELVDLLVNRGKAGLFASTGMGKSRIMLYLTSWWIRSFQTPVLFIDNPKELSDSEWSKLHEILVDNQSNHRDNPRWLLVIEDLHLVSVKTLQIIKKLVTDSGTQSWSVLIAFTSSVIHRHPSLTEDRDKFFNSVEEIRKQLQPLEKSEYFDLNLFWNEWRNYFSEWIKWTTLDVLVDVIPWKTISYEFRGLTNFESPWAMVVSIGFLKAALSNLQKTQRETIFPVLLYGILSFLYIIREEQNIKQDTLNTFLFRALETELTDLFENPEWKETVLKEILNWTDPSIRLLPPIKYRGVSTSLQREIEFSFYHQEWAREVCNILFSQGNSELFSLITKIIRSQVPNIYALWKQLAHVNPDFQKDFRYWLQENVRLELNSKGELILVHLNLNPEEIQFISSPSLLPMNSTEQSQIQLLNWAFIKKVVEDRKIYS